MPTQQSNLLSPQLLAKLQRMELVSRKIFRGRTKGERGSVRKGQSVEFADFRNYSPGDDLRFLDWNLYARLEKLFLKLFLDEEDLHFYTLIDDSKSMKFGEPTKFHLAKQLAAALGFVGLSRGDRVRIETLNQPRTQRSPSMRARHHLWRMLDSLESLQAEGETDLQQGVKNFCLRNRTSGIVVLISDLLDKSGYQQALRSLLAQKMDIYVIHLLSMAELEPDVTGDLRLVDCEDQSISEISVSAPLLKKYKRTVLSFIENARKFCTSRGISYLFASSDTDIEALVTSYLRRGGLVK